MNGSNTKRLLVAVGSAHGDDRAAWEVADSLPSQLTEQLSIKKTSAPINMLGWLDGIDELHIVDACEGGGMPGELLRCDWEPKSRVGWPELQKGTNEIPAICKSADNSQGLPSKAQSGSGPPLMLRQSGTHDFDVLSVFELARTLNLLPERIIIWAIVGMNFAPCDRLASEIKCQVSTITAAIEKEIANA